MNHGSRGGTEQRILGDVPVVKRSVAVNVSVSRGTKDPSDGRPAGRRSGRALLGVAAMALVALASSCAPPPPPDMTPAPAPVERSDYAVMAGLGQLYVVGALEGDRIVVSSPGVPERTGSADRLGSLAVRELEQGRTYTVTNLDSGDVRDARILVEGDNPPDSFYRRTKMREGLNYIPMRDGTMLAATVRPPIGQSLADGPFPTVVEYSGYQIAAPNEPLLPKIGGLFKLPGDPLAPDGSTDVGSLLVRLAGYATVSLQMRGSGCSGGEADLFDLPTRYDGYDAIETIARQWWVKGGRVGMVGISFSGFSQIATAATHPPHLAAIAPLSFVGSLYDLGRPGGIFNNGFAESWLTERQDNARPAPDPGAQPYANYLVATDAQCRANQRLRLQTRDAVAMVRETEFVADIYRARDFRPWMSQIEVPTFASLQFNDEETSPYAILSAQDLLDANDKVWLNLSNGHHRDAITPDTLTELFEFLDIYVARRAPEPKLLVNLLSDVVFGEGSASLPLPASLPPLERVFDWTLRDAQRQFESRPRLSVMLGLQSGMNEGRNKGTKWRFGADRFPVAGSTERTWYLSDAGRLTSDPGAPSRVTYTSDPSVRPATSGEAGETSSDPISDIEWTEVPAGNGVGFVTDVLTEPVVALGAGAANLRISSSAPDTDLAVVVSEVRPDGQEMFVSLGVQRASMRHTALPAAAAARDGQREPVLTRPLFTMDRREPLDGEAVTVPVQILPMGHVFNAGSRIRVSIHAVGGDMERWAFDTIDATESSVRNTVHLGGLQPSSVTMTLLGSAPTRPVRLACPAAGMPCRDYVPALNGG